MPGPLDGYRVIDLTSMVSGPLATMMLGDQGADVIKVEAIGQGDHTRTGSNRSNGLSSGFLNVNRNKRSIAVNLKDPRGRDAVMSLAAHADVFIQNFRPGVVERLGVGEPDIRAVNPGIVYVSINGFGETGPTRTSGSTIRSSRRPPAWRRSRAVRTMCAPVSSARYCPISLPA